MSEEANDQITKEPETPFVKQKDPKKVAAGKKLAEYRKNAKKAAAISNNEESNDGGGGWMPKLSLTTALTVIGIGLTAADLYLRWKKSEPAIVVRRSPAVVAAPVVVPPSGME